MVTNKFQRFALFAMLIIVSSFVGGCSSGIKDPLPPTTSGVENFYEGQAKDLETDASEYVDFRLEKLDIERQQDPNDPSRTWPFVVISVLCKNKTNRVIEKFLPIVKLNEGLTAYLYTGVSEYPFEVDVLDSSVKGYSLGLALQRDNYTDEDYQLILQFAKEFSIEMTWNTGEETVQLQFE